MDNLMKHLKEAWQAMDEDNSSTLIIVDIQPEYSDYMGFSPEDFCEWLNEKSGDIIMFWNGPELGMSSKEDIVGWYYEHGLSEELIDSIKWHDKSYAFFRYCIDSNNAFEETVKLVRYMWKHDINDSRDIDSSIWDEIVDELELSSTRELLEFADDCIHIPDLMEVLNTIKGNISLCGGGRHECLAEVEIALGALGKSYKHIDEWIY